MKGIKKYILILLLIFACPLFVKGAEVKITIEEAQKMIQESMKAYYTRGSYFQYNTAKYAGINNGYVLPEEATSQDNKYLVCSGFVHASMKTAFGIASSNATDLTTFESTAKLLEYGNNNKNNKNNVVFYATKNNQTVYYQGTNYKNKTIKYSDFINELQTGDIIVYTGHTMVVYDFLKDGNGNRTDVLLLHSWQAPYIESRLISTYQLSYNDFPTTKSTDNYNAGKNYISDLPTINEGTVKQALLSKFTQFKKNNNIMCSEEECTVIRPFYKKTDKTIFFNFDINDTLINKTKLRTQYSNLKIEKTSNVGDNNVVSKGSKIKYTIKITNNSKNDYEKFTIKENLGDLVSYDSSTQSGSYKNDKGNKTITWNISGLKSGKSIEITYTVKVTGNKNKVIESKGYFYKTGSGSVVLNTGTVINKIVTEPALTKYTYETCYNKHKTNGRTGLSLIEATYNCATGTSHDTPIFDFKNFKFNGETGLIEKSDTNTKNEYKIKLNTNHSFSKMILNDYWGGLVQDTKENKNQSNWSSDIKNNYFLPKWTKSNSPARAKTINPNDFQDGDILIYEISKNSDTLEKGIYAYIYLKSQGKFVGVNGTNLTTRNEFYQTYYSRENWSSTKVGEYLSIDNLYRTDLWKDNNTTSAEKKFINYQTLFGKDNYVILRPSLVMTEEMAKGNTKIVGNGQINGTGIPLSALGGILFIVAIVYTYYMKIQSDKKEKKKTKKQTKKTTNTKKSIKQTTKK